MNLSTRINDYLNISIYLVRNKKIGFHKARLFTIYKEHCMWKDGVRYVDHAEIVFYI